jgi:hypothetical protein
MQPAPLHRGERDFASVGRCKFKTVLKACAWFQLLKLRVKYHDELLSSAAFNCNSRPYTSADSIVQAVFNIIDKMQPQAWWVGAS